MLNERLKNLRLAKGLTLQQVGDSFGISKASISAWESGKSHPDHKKLEKLADILGTTVQFLISGTTNLDNPRHAGNPKIPFIEWNLVGKKIDLNNQTSFITPVHSQPSSSSFATRYMASTSIEWQAGSIPAGGILIVDPEATLGPNDTVVALLGTSEPFLAKYVKTPENKLVLVKADTRILMPIKPDKCKIMGVVLEWQLSAKLK